MNLSVATMGFSKGAAKKKCKHWNQQDMRRWFESQNIIYRCIFHKPPFGGIFHLWKSPFMEIHEIPAALARSGDDGTTPGQLHTAKSRQYQFNRFMLTSWPVDCRILIGRFSFWGLTILIIKVIKVSSLNLVLAQTKMG